MTAVARLLSLAAAATTTTTTMPKAFTSCVRGGGRVRTMKPRGARSSLYVKVCYSKGGRAVAGHPAHRHAPVHRPQHRRR